MHHGIWDMDIPCAPILTDITINGRAVKAVAQPTKQAYLYVFDRVTGKADLADRRTPGREGRRAGRVVFADAAVSHASRRRTIATASSIDDLIDFTPELRAEAIDIVKKYKIGPIFTPPVVSKAEGPLATLTMGTAGGGSNWPGGSYDPETHILYVFSQSAVTPLGLVPHARSEDYPTCSSSRATH